MIKGFNLSQNLTSCFFVNTAMKATWVKMLKPLIENHLKSHLHSAPYHKRFLAKRCSILVKKKYI